MKVKCNKCDKERTLSKANAEELIEKFGSEDKLVEGYLCRTCKKERKESK